MLVIVESVHYIIYFFMKYLREKIQMHVFYYIFFITVNRQQETNNII